MDGFKDSTRMKYMTGGPVKKMRGGMMDEGVSSRPVDKYGRRMTNEELGMTPGGVDPAKKKPVAKSMNTVAEREGRAAKKKPMPKVMSDLERARMMVRPLARKEGGGVPAYSDKPMIRRSKGGLMAMPKGKCK
jgi:hypothetical protein